MVGVDEPMTVGGSYALCLLNDWREIALKSQAFREKMLSGEISSPETKDITRKYVAKMTEYWGELRPKIEGRNDERIPRDFAEEFMKFELYYYNPAALVTEENAGDIFKLESVLRRAIERLRITVYEW